MTFSEVTEIGKECLVKYEPRLKVMGKKPYDDHAILLSGHYESDSLSTATKEAIQEMIGGVLDKLLEMKDGFVMSGSRYTFPIKGIEDSAEVCHNKLSLSFTSTFSGIKSTLRLQVDCWYYPVD